MSNIIKFPNTPRPQAIESPEITIPTAKAKSKIRSLLAWLAKCIWVMTVLIWPFLKWVLSMEVLFQFLRMLYYWDTPGVFAGWTFMLHFISFGALTYFFSAYKPKGF